MIIRTENMTIIFGGGKSKIVPLGPRYQLKRLTNKPQVQIIILADDIKKGGSK